MKLHDTVRKAFRETFGSQAILVQAPGRINLIGEHVDYNEGLVIPAAISHSICFAAALSGTSTCCFRSLDLNESFTFETGDRKPGHHWVNYLMGVMDEVAKRGHHLSGVNLVFAGDIPVGGGMSSSAALCCGFAFALNELLQLKLTKIEIVLIAQGAEHHFIGARVGIMDQYASVFGKKDHALLLDCKTVTHEYLPTDMGDFGLLLIDTKVKHSLASSSYNDRRLACEQAVSLINKKHPTVLSLRDITPTMLYEHQDVLGDELMVKATYVVEEISRTKQAADHIRLDNWKELGSLMYATHWGLSQAYEVSCAELDFLAMLAEDEKNRVPGARMMGGGFGGCTLNLIEKNFSAVFEEMVRDKYFTTFGIEPDFHRVTFEDGVHLIST